MFVRPHKKVYLENKIKFTDTYTFHDVSSYFVIVEKIFPGIKMSTTFS